MSDNAKPVSAFAEHIPDGLLILFRLKNNQMVYSIMNRPLPTSVNDHALATGIVEAGQSFKVVRKPKDKVGEAVNRDDGRTVTYKESIDIDWEEGKIVSTRGKHLTLTILSLVIQDLMGEAMREHDRQNPHGAN